MIQKFGFCTLLFLSLCFFLPTKLLCENDLRKNKQKIHTIKIVTKIRSWRKWEKPFNIEKNLKSKLKEMGFKLFPDESDSFDAVMYVNYSEAMGVLLRSGNTKLGYTTDIICRLKLISDRKILLFDKSIEWLQTRLSPGSIYLFPKLPRNQNELYDQNITSFQKVIYWQYLDRFLLSQLSGEDEIQVLKEILGDANETEFRKKAAKELGKSGDVRAVDSLINSLNDRPNVVQDIIVALGEIRDPKAVNPLINILERLDKRPNIHSQADVNRATAAEALGRIADKRAIVPLVAALKQKSRYVREKAASALDSLDWKPQTTEQRAYYLVAKKQWHEVIKLRSVAVPALINVLDVDHLLIQPKAAWALGEIGDKRAIKPLKKLSKNRIKEIREAANLALQKIENLNQ